MNVNDIKGAFTKIGALMDDNKDYLISLDQQNGDGDLGVSMSNGFKAVNNMLSGSDETDVGRVFMNAGKAFNEASPSTLGTILSFCMMGMAKTLRGKTEADISELALAFDAGLNLIMEKAGSKPGEKTILDALYPAVEALKLSSDEQTAAAFKKAAEAAAAGSESTKEMRSVHGRAAYYGDKSIGVLDGGSVAGKLIFEGLYDYVSKGAENE